MLLPRTLFIIGDGVNDWRPDHGQSGASNGSNKGDDEIQSGHHCCQGEGDQDQDNPQEILHHHPVLVLHTLVDVAVDCVNGGIKTMKLYQRCTKYFKLKLEFIVYQEKAFRRHFWFTKQEKSEA